MLQYKICRQKEYSSTKYSVSMDLPVQRI
jgi:hypothetical protein